MIDFVDDLIKSANSTVNLDLKKPTSGRVNRPKSENNRHLLDIACLTYYTKLAKSDFKKITQHLF